MLNSVVERKSTVSIAVIRCRSVSAGRTNADVGSVAIGAKIRK